LEQEFRVKSEQIRRGYSSNKEIIQLQERVILLKEENSRLEQLKEGDGLGDEIMKLKDEN